jgi:hypothetical protein
MSRFDVEFQDRDRITRVCISYVEAGSPAEALMRARPSIKADPHAGVYAVYRRRRVRGRRLVGYFAGGSGGEGDGLAGVREPRRPLPDPGHLAAEQDLPAEREFRAEPDLSAERNLAAERDLSA